MSSCFFNRLYRIYKFKRLKKTTTNMFSKIKYTELKKTEFWSFFGIKEKESVDLGSGKIKKIIKPGGFQEFVDIEFHVNEQDEVFKAILRLHRSWVGDDKHLNPFAQDISKSFIEALTSAADMPNVKDLIDIMFKVHGSQDHVISIYSEIKVDTLKRDIKNIIDTMLGVKESSYIQLSGGTFKFNNLKENDVAKFVITYEMSIASFFFNQSFKI